MNKGAVKNYFDHIAHVRDRWKKRNQFYYQDLTRLLRFVIPPRQSVLEIGCGTGDLLNDLEPSYGVGIDISGEMIRVAREKYSSHTFFEMDAENLAIEDKFDYVVMSDLIGHLDDVQKAFQEIHKVADHRTRIVLTYYNSLWEPMLRLAELLKLKMPQHRQNWLSPSDIENLLGISDFEIIKRGQRFLCPKYVPLIASLLNRYVCQLPVIRKLCIYHYLVARRKPNNASTNEYSLSVVIPARNEKANIGNALLRIPKIGEKTEVIFVEGHSTDGTLDEIARVVGEYKGELDVKYLVQDGKGKGDAVRKGFSVARGDVLCILDADLTVPPEELSKFYELLVSGKGEFINGSRLVYAMDKGAMRFLNHVGNKFFSLMFTWLLDQKFKDTLCGTKMIFREDYEHLARHRDYFGNFDPFGDFDLIFGASKLNLKIVELPIRYRERTYGSSNISRFKHGLILLRMCLFAMRRIKFV
jgi:SAM-dependent methyltransferase